MLLLLTIFVTSVTKCHLLLLLPLCLPHCKFSEFSTPGVLRPKLTISTIGVSISNYIPTTEVSILTPVATVPLVMLSVSSMGM